MQLFKTPNQISLILFLNNAKVSENIKSIVSYLCKITNSKK